MRAADRAYYGEYKPACPIQPDSLRNRVYGAASWSSKLRADGLISYDGGLGERNIEAREFARYLEDLAMEMQPVLDTLVRATVADHEQAPKAWRFEMKKHADSLREARSHIDLSRAHMRATWQCGKAVRFYRKYRQQAEDLVRAASQPDLALQATDPPASIKSNAAHQPLRVAHECPSAVLDPPTQAGAPSLPLPGTPAEEEEVGHGSPAHAPPHKDVEHLAKEASGRADSAVRVVVEPQQQSFGSALARRVNEATQRVSCAQRTPSEAARPSHGERLPNSVPTRSLQSRDCPPHLALMPLAPTPHNKPVAETQTRHATGPRAHDGFTTSPHSHQCSSRASGPVPARGWVKDAQEAIPPLVQESEENLLEGLRQVQTMGGVATGEAGRTRCVQINAPSEAMGSPCVLSTLGRPSAPYRAVARRYWPAARTEQRPACSASPREPATAEDEVSTQEGNGARRAPWSETLRAARSPRQRLSSCPAPAPGLMIAAREPSRVAVSSRAKAERPPKTRMEFLAGAASPWRCPSSSDSAPVLELVEDVQEAAVSSAKVLRPSESAGIKSSRMGGMSANEWKCPSNVPPPPKVLALPSRTVASYDKSDAPARSQTTQLVLARELVSPELAVSAREGSSAQCAPPDESRKVDVAHAQAWRNLSAAQSRTSLAPPANLKGLAGPKDVSGQRESGARRAPWSEKRLVRHPQRRHLSLHASTPIPLIPGTKGSSVTPRSLPLQGGRLFLSLGLRRQTC
ncbi:uncharacterized protein SCHCODRAFT_02521775 [Schizophyllum commune H4-8]|nr:uncharacterized protein SCHCODRAFT_02521775 [Schizophyllum commune H4-8]KAI5884801.1 hypothetical protein SCHCODRAFT_02521775 [Schizophyllum commune H4-8]